MYNWQSRMIAVISTSICGGLLAGVITVNILNRLTNGQKNTDKKLAAVDNKKSKTPLKTPKNRGILRSKNQIIADYIRTKNWDYSVAIRVAKSENAWNWTKSFDCNRVHVNADGSRDRGLFQINDRAHPDLSDDDAFDCFKNTDYSHRMWVTQGWTPWCAYTNGSYLSHDTNVD